LQHGVHVCARELVEARARIRRAQQLLETTTQPIERIASSVGFGFAVSLREQFRRAVGTSPPGYRRSFGRGFRPLGAVQAHLPLDTRR